MQLDKIKTFYKNNGFAIVKNLFDSDFSKEIQDHIKWLQNKYPKIRPEAFHHNLLINDPFIHHILEQKKLLDIISEFLTSYPNISRSKQIGEESFYPKRTLADGELDISKTIQENFNLLRVGNNDAWPSFFYFKGVKYVLKISKG